MTYTLPQLLKRLFTETTRFSPIPRRAEYFLIVSQERTGSTLLSNLVSFHPKILMDLHLFYTPETWPVSRRPGRRVFSRSPVRGFKFKTTHTPRQSSASEARQFFLDKHNEGVKIIRLQRQNLFRQALSAQMVGKRNELHVWKDSRKDATTDFRKTTDVDVRDLIGRMQYIEALTRFQDQSLSGIPHLEICYERDLLPQKEHQNTANRIFEFLGLAPTPVQTQLRKLTSNDLSQIISNIEEVEEALKNTRFAGFLDAYAQPS